MKSWRSAGRYWLALAAAVGLGVIFRTTVAAAPPPPPPDIWLQVSPVSNTLELRPGQTYDGQIRVKNSGSQAFNFSLSVSPYYVTDLTYQQKFDKEIPPYSQIIHWISLEKTNYQKLSPGSEIAVPYQIKVPKDAPGGGQYAAIFAQTEGNPSGSIQTINRVGSLFYAHVAGQTRQTGRILSVAAPHWYLKPPIKTTALVKNTGNIDFVAKQTMIVKGIFGGEVHRQTIGDKLILPGTTRQLEISWDKTPTIGLYRVTNQIEFLGKVQFSKTRLVIVVPIWLMILAGLVLLAGLTIMFKVIRRALRRPKSRPV